MNANVPPPKFDAYVDSYRGLHKQNIAASGEDPQYFHEYKLACLRRLGVPLGAPLLDYGCGLGNLTELFVRDYAEVHGFDPSKESLHVAAERAPSAKLHETTDTIPDGHFATAVLSGVLHHIPVADRNGALETVRRKLAPGGRVVVFEHNPLNPLTQRAVKTCEFDDDAILLWPWEAKRTLERAGFDHVKHDFIVFFPRPLAKLRAFEPKLRGLALGAQQMLVGVKLAGG